MVGGFAWSWVEVRRRISAFRRWSFFILASASLAATPLRAQTGQSRADSGAGATAETRTPVRTNSEGRFEFDVATATGRIEVDGELGDVEWRGAPVIPLPFEASPGDNTPAPVATRCHVTYDESNLYLGCVALDPDPQEIRAYITDRDDIAGHDQIVFTIDPFNDARRAFQFGVNPLGVQYDAVFSPGTGSFGGGSRGPADASWDAIWASSGRITGDGYSVEVAIPFKSLRFPSSEGVQTWGFYVTRQWPRSESVETRSMLWDRDDSCELCQTNLLLGFESVSPGTNLEFTPTLTSTRTDERPAFPDGPLDTGDVDPSFGLDGRWSISSDLALNATVNPDFSQVEADVAQLDVNNRFALFFPEKRPFFLEGADFFGTPIQALFTRSIADPRVGAKVTGKMGARAVGLLVTQDAINNILIPGDQSSGSTSLDQSVVTVAGRYRHDVGSSSNVGAMFVGREGEGGYYNRVAGVDAFVRLLPALTAQLQYLHTETRYPASVSEAFEQPREGFGGDAATVMLRYNTRNWFGGLNATQRSPDFRADAGFVPRVDWRDVGAWVDRRFWADNASWFTSIVVSGGFWHQENTKGRLTEEGLWANVEYQGPLQSSVWLNPMVRSEYFDGVEYRGLRRLWFGGSIQPSGSFSLTFNGNVGDAVDLTNSRQGRTFQLNPGATFRIGRNIDLRITQSVFDMNTVEGDDVFTAHISQVRAVYNFSPRSFFRAIVQYRDTDRTPDTHVAEVDRSRSSLFSQLLFSYKVNPQTVLFLGYTDSRDGLTTLDFEEIALTQASRAFFLKLGYAWRP